MSPIFLVIPFALFRSSGAIQVAVHSVECQHPLAIAHTEVADATQNYLWGIREYSPNIPDAVSIHGALKSTKAFAPTPSSKGGVPLQSSSPRTGFGDSGMLRSQSRSRLLCFASIHGCGLNIPIKIRQRGNYRSGKPF